MGFYFGLTTELVAIVCMGAVQWRLGYRVMRLFRWRSDEADPTRRALLRTAGTAAVAAPFALVGFGTFVERTALGVRVIDIPVPDLHHDLEGLRLVQISDIHL